MALSPYYRLWILGFLIFFGISTLFVPSSSEDPGTFIGDFYECAHSLKGKIFAKNDREIIIQGFHYDGIGPAAWFHAMKKGIKGGVHTSEPSYYYTLPYPDGKCDPLIGAQFAAYGKEITLTLPVSIKELETIGMYCYKFCHNFGHVEIPKDLNVSGVPANLGRVKPCPDPRYQPCFSKGRGSADRISKQGGPNCSPVGPSSSTSPSTPKSTSGPPPPSFDDGDEAHVPDPGNGKMHPTLALFIFLRSTFIMFTTCILLYSLVIIVCFVDI